MTLEHLNPELLKYTLEDRMVTLENLGGRGFDISAITCKEIVNVVQTVSEANGVAFDCPDCSGEHAHKVVCWDTTVPPFASPARYRWAFCGDLPRISLHIASENPFVIDREEGCRWRKSIVNGEIVECQHK